MIDRHVPKRGSGPSVGTLLVLAAINRAVAPTSKAGMATWYERTSLSRWFQLKPTQLTSQRFWDTWTACHRRRSSESSESSQRR